MIPLPFIEPKAGYPIYRLKLERLQQLLPGESEGLDTICNGILGQHPVRAAAARRALSAASPSHPDVTLIVLAFALATAAIGGGRRGRPPCRPTIGAVVPPRPDRWHSAPTPTMGGMAIAIGDDRRVRASVLAVRHAASAIPAPWLPVLLAAAGDVRRRLLRRSPAALAARQARRVAGHRRVPRLRAGRRRAGGRAAVGGYTLFGTVWFAGICHAMNLLDNMDGLAAGVGTHRGRVSRRAARRRCWARRWSSLLVALAGALLGFLYWNRPPARLFMGDCGSLFIGAILGGASLVPLFNVRASRSSARRARRADPGGAVVRHRVRAGAAPAGRTQGVEGRHRSRVAPAGVARFLRAQRGPDPLSLGLVGGLTRRW